MAKPPHSPIVRRITQSLFPPHPARIAPVQPSTLRHGGASSRPFHTTPIRSGVRRSPGLRRAESKNVPGGLVLPHTTGRGQRVDRDGFWWARLRFDLGLCLRQFDESANTLYEHTTKIKLMPPGVSFKTFKSVAEQLIRLSHAEYASHGSIKTISTGSSRAIDEVAQLNVHQMIKTDFIRRRRGISNRMLSSSSIHWP